MNRNLSQYLFYLLLRMFALLTYFLSTKLSIVFGKILGNIFRLISKKRYYITLENLKNAFPKLNEIEIKKIAKNSYYNLGITFVEFVQMKNWKLDYIYKKIKFENLDLVDNAVTRGNGVIIISGHYGNWELLAFSAGVYFKNEINLIALDQSNKYINKYLNEIRTSKGNKVISMNKAARRIVSLLSNGGMIALLVDQSATEDKDVFIDFFGRPASTYEAPAALALKFNSALLMALPVRDNNFNYTVKMIEIDHSDLQNNKEGILELSKRHVKVLEDQIKERPDLWSWQHRRWKHIQSNENE